MILSDLEFFKVELPSPRLGEPIVSILARLTTHNGFHGWGETRLKWRPEELPFRRERLLSALSGRSVFDIEEITRIEELRNAALCWGIECACWDLIGKWTGQPIRHFFGGEYRHHIPLVARLQGATPEEITETSMELLNQGFRWQILPLTGYQEKDRRNVRMLLETVGERLELQLDGAIRFTKDDALNLAREWENAGVSVLIDPLLSNDISELQHLQSRTSLPIGVRRAIRSPQDLLTIISGNAPLQAVIEPARIGSLHATRKCADIAEAAGMRLALSNPPSVGISAAATLQLIAALPAFSGGNEGFTVQLQHGILKDRDAFEISDGLIRLPQGPGLGVEVDRLKIDRYLFS